MMKGGLRYWCVMIMTMCITVAWGQEISLKRVEPPSWWVGMNNPNMQLMMYGENIGEANVKIDHQGVQVEKVYPAENKNYLFVDLVIQSGVKPGSFPIELHFSKKKKLIYHYELKQRDKQQQHGIDQGDVIYLIMPDRFANGNTHNDSVKGLKEKSNRSFHSGRHGGDIQGFWNKIDYIQDLGVTTVWINPLLENDMPEYSYHGYAITDFYAIDSRFGTKEEYRKLADELHQRDMKLIKDMVFNHCGREHWWMHDMPFADWINYYPEFINTNHANTTVSDPYASEADHEQFEKGWFVLQMPDLNHDNPFLTTYLIQNSIWWIEYAALDGIRMDTYPYNKKEFMADWAKKVYAEYPNFYLVGETWVEHEAQAAWWASNASQSTAFNSHLRSVTDFPLCFAMHKAFKKEGDVHEIYKVLSKDFLYDKPFNNKIFFDNHDMDRFLHVMDNDVDALRMALTFLLTTRGIPQLFYGTEILMKGHGEHGILREDFPGGWEGDTRNAFVEQGRTHEERETFDYLRSLLQWRKQSDAIKNGSLKHFVPQNNLYVYNRKSDKESILVLINNKNERIIVDLKPYSEVLNGYAKASDVITGKEFSDFKKIELNGHTAIILKLHKQPEAD